MSYIKVDKEQPDDPRLAETATASEASIQAVYAGADVTARYAVTVNAVFGALVRLWCHADRFILNDNTLPVTLEALAHKLGLPADVLRKFPDEWLRVRADGRVELPGYVSKNGIVGKDLRKTTPTQREGNRRRQERFRASRRKKKQANGAEQHVTGVAVTPQRITTGTGTGTDRPIPEPTTAGSLASAAVGRLARRPENRHGASSNGAANGGTGRKPEREPKTRAALREDARFLSSRGMSTPDVVRTLAQHGVTETDVSGWIAEPEGAAT